MKKNLILAVAIMTMMLPAIANPVITSSKTDPTFITNPNSGTSGLVHTNRF